MNILFLIGNGFDINLGMNTRYRDFYKHYINLPSSSSTIKKIKEHIILNKENWSDLELALGEYTSNLTEVNEFTEIYEDLSDRLGEYIEEEEKKVDIKKIDIGKLQNYLINPEDSLLQADKEIIKKYKSNWKNSVWSINVITYNYTKIFENIFDFKDIEINIGKFENSSVFFKNIEHIHGYFNNRMVLGVNDISQISNIEFQTNQNVIIDLVKPECNKVQKHLKDQTCKNLIMNTNLICIFGSSIGETDKLWWELIGEQLKRGCYVVIYDKANPIPTRRPQRKNITENEIQRKFLNKTKLTNEEIEMYQNQVLIGINTNMFDIKI